jgi:hypothetical protein
VDYLRSSDQLTCHQSVWVTYFHLGTLG